MPPGFEDFELRPEEGNAAGMPRQLQQLRILSFAGTQGIGEDTQMTDMSLLTMERTMETQSLEFLRYRGFFRR